MIKLYWSPRSRSFSSIWLMEESGLAYERVLTDISTGAQKAPDFLKINPMGKVPALKHGDQVVTETGAILCHLADAFPAAKLAPAVGARGAYYRWIFFVAGCAEPAMSNKSVGWNTTDETQRRFGYGTYDLTMDTLEKAVAGKRYIAADHFTAADLFVSSFLNFGLMFKVIDKRSAFEAYIKPHVDRPAFQKVMKQVGMAG